MKQHTEMVDLLILEKKQNSNKYTKPYAPELQRVQKKTKYAEENMEYINQTNTETKNEKYTLTINKSIVIQDNEKVIDYTSGIEINKKTGINNKIEDIIKAIIDGVEIDNEKEKNIIQVQNHDKIASKFKEQLEAKKVTHAHTHMGTQSCHAAH